MKDTENPVRILHLEDNDHDSQLIQHWLKKENINFNYFFADNESDFKTHLDNQKIDIILSDYQLPGYSGSEALLLAKTHYPYIPFVFVSGTMGEEAAIESLLNGAIDYVLKNRLERLAPAVRRALRESRLQQEYQNAIDTLRQKEEQYRTLVEGMNEGLMLSDNNDTILFVNQQTCYITGYMAEELIGNKCHQMLFDLSDQATVRHKNELRRQGIKDVCEIELLRKDKRKVWIRISGSPVYDNQGKVIGSICVFEDISNWKKAEDERTQLTRLLIKAKEKAEESDRLKSAFLANISHEIRTPMNGILGFAELLKTPELDPDVQERYIHVIEQSGKRMLNIINDIVDISKIEAGQTNLYLEEINVNHLLKDLLVFFTPEANSKGLKLSVTTDLSDEESIIETDHTKFAQILTNLIKNAIKFTKSGSIEFGYSSTSSLSRKTGSTLQHFDKLSRKQAQRSASSLNSTREPAELLFYVKDTGVGIPEDQTDMIFERFRQGSVSLTRAYEGAGLGLSISKAFVEMLGGKIMVRSKLGEGSEFSFLLPYTNQQIQESGNKEDQLQLTNQLTISILVAEDDENSLMYLKAILDNRNVKLYESTNGKEAVEFVKNHPEIDLVLMDIKMPEMDGFEAIRQIKKIRPTLPVVAQTAYAFAEDREKAREAGFDEYISKPIKKQTLLEIINKYRSL